MSIKKKILIALSAVLAVAAIVAASVAGTVAYLTASAAVSNTFTVGNVKIAMDETKVKLDGTVDTSATSRVTSNEYHLVPGKQYTKDPVLHVYDGSENAFLFVLVRNDLTPLGPKDDVQYLKTTEQMKYFGWREYTTVQQGTVYVYAGDAEGNYNMVLNEDVTTELVNKRKDKIDINPKKVATLSAAGKNYKLFEYFYTDPDQTDLTMFGSAQITVTAVAIQAAGFVDINDLDTITEENLANAWLAVQDAYPRDFGTSN